MAMSKPVFKNSQLAELMEKALKGNGDARRALERTARNANGGCAPYAIKEAQAALRYIDAQQKK